MNTMQPDPFPHAVVDWWFGRELLEPIVDEFPPLGDPRWGRFRNGNEYKLEGNHTMWGPAAADYFIELDGRTAELEERSGIPNLTMETVGGGYHLIPPGGRLAMHVDFNRSPDTGLYRRLNVLTYLNVDWTDPGGVLQLGEHAEVSVVPEMGRTVIFATSATSWHGHPVPADQWRKSIAAYFFSPEPAPGFESEASTVWL